MTVKKEKPAQAQLHFPDDEACVQILEILKPYTKQSRELILAVVRANMDRYPDVYARTAGGRMKVINIERRAGGRK